MNKIPKSTQLTFIKLIMDSSIISKVPTSCLVGQMEISFAGTLQPKIESVQLRQSVLLQLLRFLMMKNISFMPQGTTGAKESNMSIK